MKLDIYYNHKCGIYKITNTVNSKFYIGSTVNLYNRCNKHYKQLLDNIHHSRYLQSSFNKYDKDCFQIEVLELCSKEELIVREQYYIDNLKPSYNMSKIAGSNLGIKRSIETINKIKESKKGYIRSLEASIKCSNTHKILNHKPTKECHMKSALACNKQVVDIVTGIIYPSLKEAALSINMCHKQLSNKLLGKRKNNTNLKYYNNETR